MPAVPSIRCLDRFAEGDQPTHVREAEWIGRNKPRQGRGNTSVRGGSDWWMLGFQAASAKRPKVFKGSVSGESRTEAERLWGEGYDAAKAGVW